MTQAESGSHVASGLHEIATDLPDHGKSRMARDIDLAHQRRWPGRPANMLSRSWLLISSMGLWVILFHRLAYWVHMSQDAATTYLWLWRLVAIALAPLKWLLQAITKCQVGHDSGMDGGVCFSDQGHIIFGAPRTGAGTIIGTRVTIGMDVANAGDSPHIGRNVWIGSDCVVYGAVRIGDGATLLPGTVLAKSIPPNAVMQGNPARMVLRTFDNSELRARHIDDVVQFVLAQKNN